MIRYGEGEDVEVLYKIYPGLRMDEDGVVEIKSQGAWQDGGD